MDSIVKKEGFSYSFKTSACDTCKGNCCIGESGYIWVSNDEIKHMAKILNIETKEFVKSFLVKIGYAYSIKEKPYDGGFACIFFDITQKKCKVYEARPKQCRTFPFWDYFKIRITEVKKECPGIVM